MCYMNSVHCIYLMLLAIGLNKLFLIPDLPGDNVDKILALGDIREIHTRLQLVSVSIHVIVVGLYS